MSTGSDDINDVLNRLAEKIRDQTVDRSEGPSAGATAQSSSLSFEQFVEAASNSVLRAVDARNQAAGDERINLLSLPPITIGIIFRPDDVRALGLPAPAGERMVPMTAFIAWLMSPEGQKALKEAAEKAERSTEGERSTDTGVGKGYEK